MDNRLKTNVYEYNGVGHISGHLLINRTKLSSCNVLNYVCLIAWKLIIFYSRNIGIWFDKRTFKVFILLDTCYVVQSLCFIGDDFYVLTFFSSFLYI